MICEYCNKELGSIGMIGYCNHIELYHITKIKYKVPTDIEMREMFIELSMPMFVFDSFNYARPTEMEKIIVQDNFKLR